MLNSLRKIYFYNFSANRKFYKTLNGLLGYCPTRLHLYKQAFLHNSAAASVNGLEAKNNNERLEYLGDAVLDLVIAELLFKKYPFQGEGFLTEMRSKSVSRKKLSQIAFNLGLQELVQFDPSIKKNHAAVRGIAGNALEALVGAIYLDKGYSFTKKVIERKIIGIHLDFEELKNTTENFKSLLNQYAQKEKKELEFKVLNENSDKRISTYIIAVFIDGQEIAKARGKSKKVAEQLASEKTVEILKLKH